MDKKNTVTIRLTDEQFGWLKALCRRSKCSQSEVVRSLIEHGTVRERITRENLDIIRKLIGESTNLNQLARRANANKSPHCLSFLQFLQSYAIVKNG